MSTAEALAQARSHLDAAFKVLADVVEAVNEVDDLKMVSIEEAAQLLGRTKSTIHEMCKDGRLYKVDGMIPRKVIRDYEDGKRLPTGLR